MLYLIVIKFPTDNINYQGYREEPMIAIFAHCASPPINPQLSGAGVKRDAENTPKLYSGPTIQSGHCRPLGGFGLVISNFLQIRVLMRPKFYYFYF